MLATKRYVEQHEDLLELIDEINECLNFIELAKDANDVRMLLSRFFVKLKVHLAMEDGSLYPVMLDVEDDKVREMARKFVNEMGGLADAFQTYSLMWASAVAIQDNPKVFMAHTNKVMNALSRRIDKENHELFRAYNALEKKMIAAQAMS